MSYLIIIKDIFLWGRILTNFLLEEREPIILLEESVFPDELLLISKACEMELSIVFPEILLLEEPEFKLIPARLFDIVLL